MFAKHLGLHTSLYPECISVNIFKLSYWGLVKINFSNVFYLFSDSPSRIMEVVGLR